MQVIQLLHKSIVCFLLGLAALPGNAIDDTGKPAEQLATDNEQVPSEEFWLFMAEFVEDDEWIDPQDLNAEFIQKMPEVDTSEESL